jgi:glycosyltransferase involved in cell wall biosynthesis
VAEPTAPEVSVVIPAYRRAEALRRALRSVLAQQPAPPPEIIVVDDASGDDTADAARELGATVIVHEHNQGEGAARNTGLRAARHDWVALLDSDDEWLPWHLERLLALRAGHVVVGAACVAVGDGPKAGTLYGWRGPRERVLRSPPDIAWPENVLTPSATLVRRDAVLAAGGFAEGVPQAGDLDTWLRLLEQGTGLASPHVGVLYHLHGDQASGDRDAMAAARQDRYGRYRDRPWYDARVPARMAAVDAWDARDPRQIARAVARPQGAIGLAQSLAHRRAKRRAGAHRRRELRAAGVALG